MQLALGYLEKNHEPDLEAEEVLEWLLVTTWESDGCIGLWKHAERGGRPAP